jgi:thioredoxin
MRLAVYFITICWALAMQACAQNPAIKNLTVADFAMAIAADTAQVVDVRTPGEYQGGFIKHARNIDQEEKSFVKQMQAYDKSKPVYIYCLSGGRSGNAAKRLAEAGFTQIFNLDGGIMAWRNEAKPLVIDRPQSQVSTGMTLEEFKQKTSTGKVLVEFYAPWCGPCKQLKPIVQQIEKEQGAGLKVLYIDIDQNVALADALKLKQIPVLQVYANGKRQWNNVGLASREQILKKL